MTEPTETKLALKRLEDLEAIRRLKYRYMRCVDTRDWGGLARCFTRDATTNYGGKYRFSGVDAIMDFLKKNDVPGVITMHQVHHPEIELTGEETARATWALQDYVINLPRDWSLHGTALYDDEYLKVDGEWKIKHTGYRRIFSERWSRTDIKSLKVTESMHGPLSR